MKKKTRKKANKNDEIIQLLKEILEELKKITRETGNGNGLEDYPLPWKPDVFWGDRYPNSTTTDYSSGWQIKVYY